MVRVCCYGTSGQRSVSSVNNIDSRGDKCVLINFCSLGVSASQVICVLCGIWCKDQYCVTGASEVHRCLRCGKVRAGLWRDLPRVSELNFLFLGLLSRYSEVKTQRGPHGGQ